MSENLHRAEWSSLPMTAGPAEGRPLRVCIATYDLVGPVRCGGVGTAFTALARALAEAGHQVTVLFMLGQRSETDGFERWAERYAEWGVRLVPLPDPRPDYRTMSADRLVFSHAAYRWLREREFDVIHFSEWHGPGYWPVIAKRQGLAFGETTLVVGTHSPTMWAETNNRGCVARVAALELDHMERQSVALADVVISPSRYLLGWMQMEGWKLPERCYVQPNLLPPAARRPGQAGRPERSKRVPVEELVFFGRLETRKGLVLFCDAVDRLLESGPWDFRVTFLGRSGRVAGEDAARYVRRRAAGWPVPCRVITDRVQPEALDYLCRDGVLAAMPSLIDNLPMTVMECLDNGIPFVSTDVGGIPEMIAEQDRKQVLVPFRADVLADRLGRALAEGMAPARMAVDPEENRRRWLRWHDGLPRAADGARAGYPPLPKEPPLVSVCMVTHDRPELLRQAVDSIERQDYPNYEVVLVDDGSTDAEAVALLDELEDRFAPRGWRVMRQENRYLGAARNTAARHARGEYLLFMDDDNCAKEHELSAFVAIAEHAGTDILTACRENFLGEASPLSSPVESWISVFLGAAAGTGLFYNAFGDANALIRRDAFIELGGFTEEYGLGCEDWEFFAKAVLAGYDLQVVPEPLFWYRLSAESMIETTPPPRNLLRAARPYEDAVPAELRGIVLLAQGTVLGGERYGRRYGLGSASGPHLIRAGVTRCFDEGPRALLGHLWRKVRELCGRRRRR